MTNWIVLFSMLVLIGIFVPWTRIHIAWHRVVLRHEQRVAHVSVPSWDPSAKGVMTWCSCSKDWAE